MSKINESLRTIMLSDFGYFKSWYEFYFNVEKFLPEDAKRDVYNFCGSNIFSLLSDAQGTKTNIRQKLLSSLGLSRAIDFDIASDVVKLAIVDKDLLKRAMNMSGAIVQHKEIVKIISKKELENLVNFLGESRYQFIVRRAMVLWKMVSKIDIKFDDLPMIDRITAIGKFVLCHALIGLPIEMKKRLDLIFGYPFDIPAVSSAVDTGLQEQCFRLMQFAIENVKNEHQ